MTTRTPHVVHMAWHGRKPLAHMLLLHLCGLQEQKRTLDKHTNLATALLEAIKARGLDGWHNG